MIAILAEKPSVGQDIARVLGVSDKKYGYIEGNGYIITWAFGHLVTLALPEDYGIDSYNPDTLPILPDKFLLSPRKTKAKYGYQEDPAAIRQLKIIQNVFSRCDEIIAATDAGREGELIFRNIYSYLKCDKPFSRLWISSLTDKAIREGFEQLKEGNHYYSLYRSAEARSQADWLVGINASRAYCQMTGENNNSLGRVQTPTLSLICRRFAEYQNFKSQPFWNHVIHITKGEEKFPLKGSVNYYDQQEADNIFKHLKTYPTARVTRFEKKEVYELSPFLHDLTSLQKEANARFGYSADKTLSIAQKLYEQKNITYPRTGSCFIQEDVFETVPELVEFIKNIPEYYDGANLLSGKKLNTRSVNDKNVTDHHALLITGLLPINLSTEQKNIYGLIVGRMLEAFSGSCVKEVTEVHLSCDDINFTSKGWTILEKGWKAIRNEKEDYEDENRAYPEFREGETLNIESHNMIRKSTRPQPPYTDAGLLSVMEIAGLGTPATRSGIIEVLINRGYIERDEKKLIPTDKGKTLYNAVKEMMIADTGMTADWEKALQKIEETPDFYTSFINGIKVHTRHITDEIVSIVKAEKDYTETPYICPKCKRGKMLFYQKLAKCNNSRCKLIFYKETYGVKLSDEQLSELFKKKTSPLIEGFRSKKGKLFTASIEYDKDGDWFFKFPEKGGCNGND